MTFLEELYGNIINGHSSNIKSLDDDICSPISDTHPFTALHYAFIFRQFKCALKILKLLDADKIKEALFCKGSPNYLWITPLMCAQWNSGFIAAFDEKENETLSTFLSIDNNNYLLDYDDYNTAICEKANKSVNIFDIFFEDSQPLLNVIAYEKQKLAAQQIERNGSCIVMDEVGTGKTVSAIYAIRDVIENKENKLTSILIVCPYNKRTDWQKDIRRQLGRYSHIVSKSAAEDNIYTGILKRVFFKEDEHTIFIAGQKTGELKKELREFEFCIPWDLVIIDECHMCFDNYKEIKSNKVMLLTATPIVVNSNTVRNFDSYRELFSNITGKDYNSDNFEIDPIKTPEPNANNIFVNWFREDFNQNNTTNQGNTATQRDIKFLQCERYENRQDALDRLIGKIGTLDALNYEQDDWYLADKYEEVFGQKLVIESNKKLEKLFEFLNNENTKSYVIFCVHIKVAEQIYKNLGEKFSDTDTIIGIKHGIYEESNNKFNDEELINHLKAELNRDSKHRVLLILTEKSGDTGLNLGEFDGIINYELPFTSIGLEQRFGRIDRIDNKPLKSKSKEMVFILNKCENSLEYFNENRMLYYCTLKIGITLKYLPIRNTVIFNPNFIAENQKEFLFILENIAITLTDSNKEKFEHIKKLEKEIKSNPIWKTHFSDKVFDINNYENLLNVELKAENKELATLIGDYQKHVDCYELKNYINVVNKFNLIENIMYKWLKTLGLESIRDDDFDYIDEEMTGILDEEKEDNIIMANEEEFKEFIKNNSKNEVCDKYTIVERVEKLQKTIHSIHPDSISNNGIFYFNYAEKRIEHKEVGAFRKC